ncbi:ribonuclease HII [Cellulomonas endophytica]|uniref:ribonuclease HII n=1 Tax=Cellulomonas endophytica TaxID=2494735 RepID=UPI001010DF82|nr:ribonuclease HII [Cellulomonas endophytica]
MLRSGAVRVAGMDEVGRGSLAGPVSVGVVVVDLATRTAPRGVADSKLLTPAARTALLPALRRWGVARAVGHASAAEIDALGIIAALRLAGVRALGSAVAVAGPVDVVLLDGSHDWLTPRAAVPAVDDGPVDADGRVGGGDAGSEGDVGFEDDEGLEGEPGPEDGAGADDEDDLAALVADLPVPLAGADPFALWPDTLPVPVVRTRVKADRSCASVAAASVLAKCERDALMVELAPQHPEYRWTENKGYAAPEHVAALGRLGPSPWHRRSWRLPGVVVADVVPDVAGAGPGAAGPGAAGPATAGPAAPRPAVAGGAVPGAADGPAAWGMMGA